MLLLWGSIIVTCCCNSGVCLQCILCNAEDKFVYCKTHDGITCNDCVNKDCVGDNEVNIYGKILYDDNFRKLVDPPMDSELLELFRTGWRHPW